MKTTAVRGIHTNWNGLAVSPCKTAIQQRGSQLLWRGPVSKLYEWNFVAGSRDDPSMKAFCQMCSLTPYLNQPASASGCPLGYSIGNLLSGAFPYTNYTGRQYQDPSSVVSQIQALAAHPEYNANLQYLKQYCYHIVFESIASLNIGCLFYATRICINPTSTECTSLLSGSVKPVLGYFNASYSFNKIANIIRSETLRNGTNYVKVVEKIAIRLLANPQGTYNNSESTWHYIFGNYPMGAQQTFFASLFFMHQFIKTAPVGIPIELTEWLYLSFLPMSSFSLQIISTASLSYGWYMEKSKEIWRYAGLSSSTTQVRKRLQTIEVAKRAAVSYTDVNAWIASSTSVCNFADLNTAAGCFGVAIGLMDGYETSSYKTQIQSIFEGIFKTANGKYFRLLERCAIWKNPGKSFEDCDRFRSSDSAYKTDGFAAALVKFVLFDRAVFPQSL
jgi:hypothetical protein